MSKQLASAGIFALLASPLLLLIVLILGIIVFVVGMVIIVAYGLETAIAFLILSGAFVMVLGWTHVIDFKNHPWVIAVPFLMFVLGYATQHLSVISIEPPGTSFGEITLSSQSILLFQIIVIALITSIGTYVIVKSRSRSRRY